jgi:hypothetical protein
MEYVAIQSAITSGTALVQIFKGLASLKLETETLLKINDAQLKVSELLAALLGTQGDLSKLQRENDDLRGQLKTMVDWEKIAAKFQIVNTIGGATIYELIDGSPKYYACPVCFTRKAIIPLQTTDGGYYGCPSCKGEYKVGEPVPRPRPKVETDFDPRF